jgi:hypothetical protein
MERFDNMFIDCVEINVKTNTLNQFEVPFSTMANSFEEARSQALEYGQAMARSYNPSSDTTLFFKVCVYC